MKLDKFKGRVLWTFFLCVVLSSTVEAADKSSPDLNLKLSLDAVEGAVTYQAEATAENFLRTFSSKSPQLEVNLPIGKYTLKIRVADARGIFGPWSEPQEFNVEAPPVDLKLAENKYPATFKAEGLKFWVELQWDALAGASGYKLQLKNKVGKIVGEQVLPEAKARFKIRPGIFHFNVIALYARNQIAAPPSDYEPQITLQGKMLESPVVEKTGPRTFKWKSSEGAGLVTKIQYCAFWSDSCQSLPEAFYKDSIYKFEPSQGPGLYKIAFATHMEGFVDSEAEVSEILVKPDFKDLPPDPVHEKEL